MGFIITGIIGPWQIVLIVALVLLFFGGKKIPELMRGLGKGVREFKEGTKDDEKKPEEN
jgi:sec-independent protein translocase protein TatA